MIVDDELLDPQPVTPAAEVATLRAELTALQANVSVLDSAVRVHRVFGPILLLVLAAVSPLLGYANPNSDVSYTFWEIIQSSRGTGWTTVTLAVIALGWAFCVLGSFLLLPGTGSRSEYLAVSFPAGVLLFGLLVLILTGAGWSERNDYGYSGLQFGTLLAAAAAIWLITSSVTLGRAARERSRLATAG